jgi:hypothetical protein
MRTKSIFSQAIVWTAAVGLIIPATPFTIQAAESSGAIIRDVAMSTEGALQGQFIGQDGQPVSAAQVVVASDEAVIAETVTDAEGQFKVAGLQPGVYEITAGDTTLPVRVWTNEAAPPTAATAALISQPVVRAQYGYDYGTMGVVFGLVGIGLGTAALIELDDCCDSSNSP